MLSLIPVSQVDSNIGDFLFGEKEQARLLAGEELPRVLFVLLDKLTLCNFSVCLNSSCEGSL